MKRRAKFLVSLPRSPPSVAPSSSESGSKTEICGGGEGARSVGSAGRGRLQSSAGVGMFL
jgi:hypothetical protein